MTPNKHCFKHIDQVSSLITGYLKSCLPLVSEILYHIRNMVYLTDRGVCDIKSMCSQIYNISKMLSGTRKYSHYII